MWNLNEFSDISHKVNFIQPVSVVFFTYYSHDEIELSSKYCVQNKNESIKKN